jgi:poly-gamma-glutamate synthesis protein (capsule biosynthesis protein)
MVRGTADMMELKGMTYPAQDIQEILVNADILHINNEVPFSPKCPPSSQRISNQSLVFCSKPEYIELLEYIGTDIVELSGDHLQDWGPEAVTYTIGMYKERGWDYYGGGLNIDDAKKPLLIEHNGNKIAFLGCNGKDKGYAGATDTNPGAVTCDFDYLDSQISQLLELGYLPIVTFQHEEIWRTDPPDTVKNDFYAVANSGAVIASGSQSHQPQTFEFKDGSFLHFGLGNLFFDQIFEGDPYKRAFIDRHVIYNGKHISTELITTIFIDLARSRPMTQDERTALLEEIFKASTSIKR